MTTEQWFEQLDAALARTPLPTTGGKERRAAAHDALDWTNI